MKTAAVVVTHQQAHLAQSCLEMLAGNQLLDQCVVVVNCPKRLGPVGLDALKRLATVVLNDCPVGYSENLNRGIAALQPGWDAVLLLNDDTQVAPDAIQRMMSVLESWPRVGMVGARIIDANGVEQMSAFPFRSIRREAAQLLLAPRRFRALIDKLSAPTSVSPGPQIVDVVFGAAMLVRAVALHSVGGLDSDFFLYFEEDDICLRLKRAGWLTAWCREATIVHLGGASTADEALYRDVWAVSRRLYLRKHWGYMRRLTLVIVEVLLFCWNEAYVLLSTAVRPTSRPDKVRWLAAKYTDLGWHRLARRSAARLLRPTRM